MIINTENLFYLPDLASYFPTNNAYRPLEVLQSRVSDFTLAFNKWRMSQMSSALELDYVEELITHGWTVTSSVCSNRLDQLILR